MLEKVCKQRGGQDSIHVGKGPELVIAGLARDCAHSLTSLLPKLAALAARFERSHFIFLENSSVDDTKRILSQFAQVQPHCIFKSFRLIEVRHWKRCDRLAFLRNHLVSLAEKAVELPESAYYLLLDLDDVNSEIDIDYLTHLIETDDGSWAGLFANQPDAYYDLWALRHPTICPTDVWKNRASAVPGKGSKQAAMPNIDSICFSLPRDHGRLEVESAFGGLALYRFSAIRGCLYIGMDEDNDQICEHVAFNKMICANGGRLFIDSALVNHSSLAEHAPPHTERQRRTLRWRKKYMRLLRLFYRLMA
ncbi:hypothetical protein [Martelella sp. HB161492]|uniref:hypothetical protein n=1 Tax=Martelella sp. HB161492 TaxID=2720726 RepID=UPI0015912EAD|nr:hypothetical protein [Martelella sp. HB161492]